MSFDGKFNITEASVKMCVQLQKLVALHVQLNIAEMARLFSHVKIQLGKF